MIECVIGWARFALSVALSTLLSFLSVSKLKVGAYCLTYRSLQKISNYCFV